MKGFWRWWLALAAMVASWVVLAGEAVNVVLLGDGSYAFASDALKVVNRSAAGETPAATLARVEGGDFDQLRADMYVVGYAADKLTGSPEDFAETVRKLAEALKIYRPEAKLLVLPLLPCGLADGAAVRARTAAANPLLAKAALRRGGWDWFWVEALPAQLKGAGGERLDAADCAALRAEIARLGAELVERNRPANRPAWVPMPAAEEWRKADWEKRHAEKLAAADGSYDVVFIGDSITHFWEYAGSNVWQRWFSGSTGSVCRAFNLGYGADRTEHVLWRIEHGELDKLDPKVVVLMIGTNNYGHRHEEERLVDTMLGIQRVVDAIRSRLPRATVLLHALLPRDTPDDPCRRFNARVNAELPRLCNGRQVRFVDFGNLFVEPDGTIDRELMGDLLHPTEAGYRLWARHLAPAIVDALAPEIPSTLKPRSILDCFWAAARMNMFTKASEATNDYDVVFFGDSLTECWIWDGRKVWDEAFKDYRRLNLGLSGDTMQGFSWRITGGCLDGFKTKVIVMHGGGNNIYNRPEEIAAGLREDIRLLLECHPEAHLVVFGMLPISAGRGEVVGDTFDELNARYRKVASEFPPERVTYLDFGGKFIVNGRLPYMKDGQHLTEDGYRIMAAELLPQLRERIGK